MKAATPTLSAEQKRASEKYQLVFVPGIMVFSIVGFCAIEILLFAFVRVFHINIGPRSNPSSATVVVAFFAAHYWAVRKVREAGLSLESRKVEVLANRKTDFCGEIKKWYYPKTMSASLANASIPIIVSAAGWLLWHWPYPRVSPLERGLGIFCFCMFSWCSAISVVFLRAPHVQIDDDGIVGFPHPFWRQRAHWRDIARCEIRSRFDYMGRGPIRRFLFRDATGKVLLRLIPGSLTGLSIDEQAEIEAEIRRRFAAVETTSAENPTA